MDRRLLLSVTFAVAVLQGCASIGSDECQVADWRTVGLEDGAQGASPDAIGRYRVACAEHGVVPDLDAYMQGRAEGLQSYCTPGNGFNVGAQGATYGGVCPPDAETAFLDAYSSGHRLYELESAANEAQSRVSYAHAELERLKRELAADEAALISGQITTEQRVQLALDIKDMSKRQGEIERDVVGLERELDRRNRQLARYRDRLAYNP
jgi:hypothetical protein